MNGFVSLCLTCMIIAVVVAAYLLPTLVAWLRHAPDLAAVTVVNLALGWTVLGWWAALALALRKREPPVIQVFSQANASASTPPGTGWWTPRPFADDPGPGDSRTE
jgi:hypothetical protein